MANQVNFHGTSRISGIVNLGGTESFQFVMIWLS
jgi:hypothetical protein